jgi:transcriptional regulator with XRE-family HTH domain
MELPMVRLRHHRKFFLSMSHKVQCYLRTLRREWGLSQAEMASLLPKGSRSRVSRVERGVARPNAEEILAYRLIFGSPAKKLFPTFVEETVDAVMRGVYRMHRQVEKHQSAHSRRKRELCEHVLARATKKANRRHL